MFNGVSCFVHWHFEERGREGKMVREAKRMRNP